MKSSFFNINKINVKIENNKILTEAEIKDLSTINIGQNIYSINKKDIINSIKNNSYVENVKIKRKLPNAIEIQIEERTPKYQLKSDSQYIYIDEQGYILEVNSNAKDLTTIVGYQTTDFTIGNKIEESDIEKINNIPQIIQELEKNNLLNELTSIDIKDKNYYIVNFENLHKVAHLGNMTSLNEKMNFVKEIMSKEQDYEGEVFVNVDLNKGEYMKKFGKALVFGILCLILTFAITVQLRVSSLSESESSQTKITDKLKDEIFRLNDENVKLAEKFQNTTSELDDARNQAAQNDSSSKDTSELIKKYTIVSGKTDVTGQGIIIKYKPSDNEAKADMVKDLRDIVNEIKNAGAEAIEINNQRIVGTTAIEMVKNKIEINDTEVSENFIIKAIGDSNLMYSGLIRPGGTIENIRESGVSIEINSENAIKINKYNEI